MLRANAENSRHHISVCAVIAHSITPLTCILIILHRHNGVQEWLRVLYIAISSSFSEFIIYILLYKHIFYHRKRSRDFFSRIIINTQSHYVLCIIVCYT